MMDVVYVYQFVDEYLVDFFLAGETVGAEDDGEGIRSFDKGSGTSFGSVVAAFLTCDLQFHGWFGDGAGCHSCWCCS